MQQIMSFEGASPKATLITQMRKRKYKGLICVSMRSTQGQGWRILKPETRGIREAVEHSVSERQQDDQLRESWGDQAYLLRLMHTALGALGAQHRLYYQTCNRYITFSKISSLTCIHHTNFLLRVLRGPPLYHQPLPHSSLPPSSSSFPLPPSLLQMFSILVCMFVLRFT